MDLPPYISVIDIPIEDFGLVPDSVFAGYDIDRNTPDPFEGLVKRMCNYLDIPGVFTTSYSVRHSSLLHYARSQYSKWFEEGPRAL